MLTGKLFRLNSNAPAIHLCPGPSPVVTMLSGTIVEITQDPGENDGAMIAILSSGRKMLMFGRDIRDRAVEVPEGGFDSHKRLQLAAGVLSAITVFRDLCPRDAAALRLLAESDQERTMELDDLACLVILREIERSRTTDGKPPGGEAA